MRRELGHRCESDLEGREAVGVEDEVAVSAGLDADGVRERGGSGERASLKRRLEVCSCLAQALLCQTGAFVRIEQVHAGHCQDEDLGFPPVYRAIGVGNTVFVVALLNKTARRAAAARLAFMS